MRNYVIIVTLFMGLAGCVASDKNKAELAAEQLDCFTQLRISGPVADGALRGLVFQNGRCSEGYKALNIYSSHASAEIVTPNRRFIGKFFKEQNRLLAKDHQNSIELGSFKYEGEELAVQIHPYVTYHLYVSKNGQKQEWKYPMSDSGWDQEQLVFVKKQIQ